MAEIEGLVRALRVGLYVAKADAAWRLGHFACSGDPWGFANRVLIAEAGGIPPLVELLRDGSADAKRQAAWALRQLACNVANRVLIAEAGGIPPLVQLMRHGSADARAQAARALGHLARDNDANAVAIAAAVGFEALVQLARGGRVTVDYESIVRDAGVPAKRKAALVVAALLSDCVPDSVPREIKTVIGPYL